MHTVPKRAKTALILALAIVLAACTGNNPVRTAAPPTADPAATEEIIKPTWADPSLYIEERKAYIDECVTEINAICNVDIDAAVVAACEEYGRFFHPSITPEALRTAIVAVGGSGAPVDQSVNLTGIAESALDITNAFLAAEGLGPADPANPAQSIAAFAIAASHYYVNDVQGVYFVPYCMPAAFNMALRQSGWVSADALYLIFDEYYVLPPEIEENAE